MMKLPVRDPAGAYVRKSIAERRAGVSRTCVCGEMRPEAFETKKKPTICAGGRRIKEGKTIMDNHHIAGRANSPITVGIPVNDHRAELTVAQQDWPPETLENPDGSPLRAGAASIRGFIDIHIYLLKTFLLWTADMLELLDVFLVGTLGPKWWKKTDLDQFTPKRKSDNKHVKTEDNSNEKS